MDEWSGYSLQSFLMFSPATYFRLLESHNAALWPLHLLTLGLGCGLPRLLRQGRRRLAGIIMAACWLVPGLAFHLGRYAAINLAAPWFAALFLAEAALLLLAGFAPGWDLGAPRSRGDTAAVLAFLLAPPLLGLLSGRDWRQAELFGILPDPTAIATLGLLALAPARSAWLLAPLPLLWCLVGGATLAAMQRPDAWLPPAAALLALGLGFAIRRRTRP